MESIYKGLSFTVHPSTSSGTVLIYIPDGKTTGGAHGFAYKGVDSVVWEAERGFQVLGFTLKGPPTTLIGVRELNDAAIAMIDHLLSQVPTEAAPVTIEVKKPEPLAASLLEESIKTQQEKFGDEFLAIVKKCHEVARTTGETKLCLGTTISPQLRQMLGRVGFTVHQFGETPQTEIDWGFANLKSSQTTKEKRSGAI